MRAASAASVALCCLLAVANCTRRPASELVREEGLLGRGVGELADPLGAAAPADAGVPRTRKGSLSWRLPRALTLLAGASPLVGASIRELKTQDARRVRVPLAALAVRGGSAASHGYEEPDFDEHPLDYDMGHEILHSFQFATVPANEYPKEGWFSDARSAEESSELLVKSAWRTIVTTLPMYQVWDFDFVLLDPDGLHVQISYYDLPNLDTPVGSDLVKLTPLRLKSQFMGFTGTDGIFRFRFTHVGANMRIDITYPTDLLADGSVALFASPVFSRHAPTSGPPSPSGEMRDKFRRNLQRLIEPSDPEHKDGAAQAVRGIVSFLRQPGHWSGQATIGDDGGIMQWDFNFRVDAYSIICEVVARDSTIETRDFAYLSPYYIGEDFAGFAGEGHETTGGFTEYIFTVDAGRLEVEVGYQLGGGVTIRLQSLLEHRPGAI